MIWVNTLCKTIKKNTYRNGVLVKTTWLDRIEYIEDRYGERSRIRR